MQYEASPPLTGLQVCSVSGGPSCTGHDRPASDRKSCIPAGPHESREPASRPGTRAHRKYTGAEPQCADRPNPGLGALVSVIQDANSDYATSNFSRAAPLIAEVQPFLGEVEASGLAYEPEMPTSVLMLDIDHFKLYNDRYGHPEGDRCLASVAECMEQTVKPHGFLVARTGGEEFSVLMPETGLDQARICAEELRKAIAGLKLPHADSPVSNVVTVSVGVASSVNMDKVSGSTLMRSADLALYEAKDQGRNRVACFGEDSASVIG